MTPNVHEADQRAVGLRKLECPACYDTSTVYQQVRGGATGVVLRRPRTCSCRALGSFWRQWDFVDRRWENVSLANLAPSADSVSPLSEQKLNIADIKANPTSSFILAGAGNAGKTYLMYCLYRHRLEEWAAHPHAAEGLSLWMLSATEYVNAVSKHAQDPSSAAPVLTPELVRKRTQQGLPVAIFLDEVDKFPPTIPRVSSLFELVNTAYSCQAQVVMTSNADLPTLASKWGSDTGIHLLRKVGSGGGSTLTFTDKKAGK